MFLANSPEKIRRMLTLHSRYYLVYVCTNVTTLVLGYLFLPETGDRTLEDIDNVFVRAQNWFEPVKIAKAMPLGVAEGWNFSEKASPDADMVEHKV